MNEDDGRSGERLKKCGVSCNADFELGDNFNESLRRTAGEDHDNASDDNDEVSVRKRT